MLALQDNLGIYITHCRSTIVSLYVPTWTLDKSFYYVAELNNSNSLGAWILSRCRARHIISNTRRATVCNNTELHFWTEASELGQHLKGGGCTSEEITPDLCIGSIWPPSQVTLVREGLRSLSKDRGSKSYTPQGGGRTGTREVSQALHNFKNIPKVYSQFCFIFFLTT